MWWELFSVLLSIAGYPAGLWLCFRLFAQSPPEPEIRALIGGQPRQILDTGPQEPCWTEEFARDGRYIYGRASCPNGLLMKLDARARRRDFPIPIVYE